MKIFFHILVAFYFALASFDMQCISYEAVSVRLKNLEELKAIMQTQYNDFCQDGFACNTLIKTPKGYTPIQELQLGDLIVNHNGELCVIKNISKKLVSTYVEITFNDYVIVAAPEFNKHSKARVAIEDDEIVILRRSSPIKKEFHGYRITWDDLLSKQQRYSDVIKTLRANKLM